MYILPRRLYFTMTIINLSQSSYHLLGIVWAMVVHILANLYYTNKLQYLLHFHNLNKFMQYIFCKDILENSYGNKFRHWSQVWWI
jgi:hypothetical protein